MQIEKENISELVKAEGYRFVRLLSADGKSIVPYNRPVDQPAVKLITERLASEFLTDGHYKLACKRTTGGAVDTFDIFKGAENSPLPMAGKQNNKEAAGVLSYKEALELNTELAELRLKNEALEAELEEADADEPLEEGNPLQEKLLLMAVPLLDRLVTLLEKRFTSNPVTPENNAITEKERARATFKMQFPAGDFEHFWQSLQSNGASDSQPEENFN